MSDNTSNRQGGVIGATSMLKLGLVKPISCDQVAWLLDIFDRALPHSKFPQISREREMKKYGMLYEVMEIAGLSFMDDAARWNGTPNDARKHTDA
jgi:hypothetical protein